MQCTIAFSSSDTGKVIGDLTWDYCKVASTGVAVSTTGASLVEMGGGTYTLINPNCTVATGFKVHLTAAPTKIAEGVFELGFDDVVGATSASVLAGIASSAATAAAIRTEVETTTVLAKKADIGTGGAALTALGDTRIANLDAAVSSRSTFAGGAVASVTNPVTVGTNNDKTGYALAVTPPTAAQIKTELETTTVLAKQSDIGAGGAALTALGDSRIAHLDANVSSRSTYAGGTVAGVTNPVTVGTNQDKTGYALAVTPPTAAEVRTEIDNNSTMLHQLDSRIANLSVASRVVCTLPASIVRAAAGSGDKWLKIDILLYDTHGVLFDSMDHDGGTYSTLTDYPEGHRVYVDNLGTRYLFRLTTKVAGSGSAPAWTFGLNDTMVDGAGNTWTCLGTWADAWATEFGDKCGFGILCKTDIGTVWPLYKNELADELDTIHECYHRTQTIFPFILERTGPGSYYFWMNVDEFEAAGSRNFYFAWFDKARGDAEYTSVEHRKELRTTVIEMYPDLNAENIAIAVRDVSNATPAPGSLGAGVNAIPTTPAPDSNAIQAAAGAALLDYDAAKASDIPADIATGAAVSLIPTTPAPTVLEVQGAAAAALTAYDAAKASDIPADIATGAAVAQIPTNPLLDDDARLDDLDTIKQRVNSIPNNPLLTNDVRLDDLDTIKQRVNSIPTNPLLSPDYVIPDNITIGEIKDILVAWPDLWSIELPGNYQGGTAGFQVGNTLGTLPAIVTMLLNKVVAGIVSMPQEVAHGDRMIFHKKGAYSNIAITIGQEWSTYLDGSYDIYFTLKEKTTDTLAAMEVTGSIGDQTRGVVVIQAISSAQMNVKVGTYTWQVQLRKDNPLDIRVTAEGLAEVKPTLKL